MSKTDNSDAFLKDDGYEKKKAHYQTEETAEKYDEVRWSNPSRRRSNARKFKAIDKAISVAASLGGSIHNALDIPCGTGRIFPFLASKKVLVTMADLSLEMMEVAKRRSAGSPFIKEYVRCDAEAMPFADNSFDAVFSIRFLFHLPEGARRGAIKEMARVSREWVIVDCRHKYTLKYLFKSIEALIGLSKKPYERLGLKEIKDDLKAAGLEIIKIFPTFPLLSDKWVILCRK